jgi:dihydroorotate dehydrogenase
MSFIIKTKRLGIIPLNSSMLETTHIYATDLNVTKYMLFLPNKSIEETKSFLEYVEDCWKKNDLVVNKTFECAIIYQGEHIGAVSLYIENEIAAVVKASKGMLVKVILETCYLTDDEIFECCQAAALAGADFVKTSTGFGPGGATAHHVEIMKKAIPASMQVKASGGVRTLEDFNIMVNAGATRIGASSGVKIMEGISGDSNDSNSSY